jgi:hypothetical protein
LQTNKWEFEEVIQKPTKEMSNWFFLKFTTPERNMLEQSIFDEMMDRLTDRGQDDWREKEFESESIADYSK